MRKFLVILFLLSAWTTMAQTNLQQLRKKSYQVMVFKTTAANAERYITKDSIPLAEFETVTPSYIFPIDTLDTDNLPVGHYVLVKVIDNELIASMIGVSNLLVYPVNNRYNIQLDIRNRDGAFLRDAKVWANGREVRYDDVAQTYLLRQKKVEEAFIKIYAPGDTLLMSLEQDEEPRVPIWKQRWRNFKATRVGRVATWAPQKVALLFNKRRYKRYKKQGDGYVLLNQPKYKLTDTVKLKAYLMNRHHNRYKKNLDLFLDYAAKGKQHSQLLKNLPPVSAGSFVYSFPLSDTLVSDIKYSLVFKDKKGKRVIAKTFSTEDYVLDEIGSYAFRSQKELYYPGDTLTFFASAKDANGLPLLDGDLRLTLTTLTISGFDKDTMYVSDTLYIENKPLATEAETLFKIPTSSLPAAQLGMIATLGFKNSNNEIHEEKTTISLQRHANNLQIKVVDDSIFATCLVNGKSIETEATVYIVGEQLEKEVKLKLPAVLKIDPLAEKYSLTAIIGKDTLRTNQTINNNYNLSMDRIGRKDTIGFVLNNPYRIPVNFVVLQNKKLVGSGKSDNGQIKWETVAHQKRHMYMVKWQYMWGGERREGTDNIALLYKLLRIEAEHNTTVFPGQKDSVSIMVTDYKGRPAADVNLAAVAYNSQFKKNINVPEPPYLTRYKNHPSIDRGTHEIDDAYITKRYSLGNYKPWIKRFGLDSIQFYKMLFPTTTPMDVVSPISEFIPQISVHVVQKGKPQEIYLLYVNRQLVYYNGVTDKMNFAFPAMQGYTQVACRLFNRYIQIDSIYVQPFYKHDIVIDLDKLPATAFVKEMPTHWTSEERNLIEKSIWQLDNDYKTNYGYVWQDTRLVKLSGSNRHLVGPFSKGQSIQFFAPTDFDISFPFESGYRYTLSKQLTRLEKQSIFDNSEKEIQLPKVAKATWILGDTIVPSPEINYPIPQLRKFIKLNFPNQSNKNMGTGKMLLTVSDDTSIALKYVILIVGDKYNDAYIFPGHSRYLTNIYPGTYSFLLVNKDWSVAQKDNVVIRANETFCLHARNISFKINNRIIENLISESITPITLPKPKPPEPPFIYTMVAQGTSAISGIVTDAAGGNGIPNVTVMIKNSSTGTSTWADGNFIINNIKWGKHTIVISSIGYNEREIDLEIFPGQTTVVNVSLSVSTLLLNEVVVTGYGIMRSRSFTGATSKIILKELSNNFYSDTILFTGRLAGVSVGGNYELDNQIRIRGAASITGVNKPIYVIDGIIYDELPAHIKPEMIASMDVLKDAAATALYGARGANGVILISTGAKTIRSVFKDYALWQPEMFTNAEGKAKFEVTYPDNITGWDMYVLGMDKHLRIGKGRSFTRAYKPVAAQISTPQFLIEGDSAYLVGKALNYTDDDYTITTTFSLSDKVISTQQANLTAKGSVNNPLPAYVVNTDTLKASFTLATTTRFTDGEERKIPVFRQGTEETQGEFYVVQGDTTITFLPKKNGGPVSLYVQNNTLDLLLEELQLLKDYPYYCMEQTASKLKGLLMEQKIMQVLDKPFVHEKDIKMLLKKLQESQLFEGGWSWWEKGKPDLYISGYVIDALLAVRGDVLVETNIRNGLLYLQNQLPHLQKSQLLFALNNLSNAGHIIDYKPYIDSLRFDSLSFHQQWLYVQVLQKQGIDHKMQLKKLVDAATPTMLGGLHWGTENYRWYSNQIATTIVAYQVLEKEKEYMSLLPKITQYFLEQKRGGYYRNTVEAASIVATILPGLMQNNLQFNQPARVQVNGDTSFFIPSFPFKAKLSKSNTHVTVNKSGGGLTYITLYQKWWNTAPVAVTDKFIISTRFNKNGQQILTIPAGEKVKMVVHVKVLADAEYVMIEMPIPAGCNYSTKSQSWGNMHKEYFKNKVVLFAENLHKGDYDFEIELEPRYKGTYTLNPAKAELMYFPTFYGRNEIRKVEIK